MKTQTALIALGSNIAPTGLSVSEGLGRAIAALGALAPLTAISRFWQNPAFPKGAGPDFVNAAVSLEWTGEAQDLLDALKRIEVELGRQESGRWAARVIDLDLVAFGNHVLPDLETYSRWRDLPLAAQQQETPEVLILPHPRLQDRAFVLVPLAEIAPSWTHPVSGQTIQAMRDGCAREALAEMTALPATSSA